MFIKLKNRHQKAVNMEEKTGLKIVYDDVAPYAKENSNPQIMEIGLRPHAGLYPGKKLYPRPTIVKKEFPDLRRDDLSYPGYALCYPGFSLLDGNYINLPDNPQAYGYISDEWSNENRKFGYTYIREGLRPGKELYPRIFLFPGESRNREMTFPALTITFNRKFSSVGILLTFNLLSGDFASSLTIRWYEDGVLISEKDFTPDSNRYFCGNYVQGYNMVTITFKETSKPFRPVFLTRIDYGIYRDFKDDEIAAIDCIQEINAISENISINTLSFTVRTRSDVPFDLQKKQKLSVYFDEELIGDFYLKNGARKNVFDYYLDAHDAIGILDGNEFSGGIYNGETAGDVIQQIFEGEDFSYHIDDAISSEKLYGYIPYTTKRNALVQIAFAIGAIVDTSNYNGVVIYPQQTETSGRFTKSETFDGVTLEHTDIVTGIRLTAHTYQPGEKTEELYNDVLNGTAEVILSEPYHSFSVEGGEIQKSGPNNVVITGTGKPVIITGKKYVHSTTQILKENPDITYNKSIKEVTDATLIHPGNAEQALNRIYNYYQRAESVVGDVLLSSKVIGQMVRIDTGYEGEKEGTIESVDYSFGKEIKARIKIHE